MSLIDHIGYDKDQLSALLEDRRATITPNECDRGKLCYVRDGVTAYKKAAAAGISSVAFGLCVGCRGKIRAFEIRR